MKSKQFLIIISLAFLAGCSNQQPKENDNNAQNTSGQSPQESGIVGMPASGSKFSKIKIGMS